MKLSITLARMKPILLLLLLLMGVLVACGGTTEEPEATPVEEVVEPEEEESSAEEEEMEEEEPAEEAMEEEEMAEEEGEMEEEMAEMPEICRGQDGSGLKVGFGNLGEQVPFAVQVREGLESVAAECNLEIVNADNALDPQIAVDNTNLFVTQQVDGIIHFNVHGDIAESICEIKGDIPMIAIDIAHEGCSVFMGANNREAGETRWYCRWRTRQRDYGIVKWMPLSPTKPPVSDRLILTASMVKWLVCNQRICPNIDTGDFENWSMDPIGILTRLDSDRVDPGFEKGRDYLTANQDKQSTSSPFVSTMTLVLGMLAAVQEAGREGRSYFQ